MLLRSEAPHGFKEKRIQRIQGDFIEERLKKPDSKLDDNNDDNNVALAKTTQFDTKIQNDNMAVLTKVAHKCASIENAVFHNFTNKYGENSFREK